jgi:hypothetical protein
MRTPGPLHAFGQRVAARRGRQVAIVAVARKIACLAWRLLTSGQDYAYASPSRVALKLRRIELRAGAPRHRGRSALTLADQRKREREVALAAERAYRRLVADRQAGKTGAGAAVGRAPSGVLTGPSSAADSSAPASAL